MNIRQIIAASVFALAAFGSQANAATVVGLYNTGVDAVGNPLALGAQDFHYTVIGPGAYVGNPYVYDHPAYIPAGSAAGWIAVQPDGGYPGPQGTAGSDIFYSEFLTFTITGFDAATVLSGKYASDNSASIILNGNLISALPYEGSYPNFQSLTSFSANSSLFLNGVNTLEFRVSDWGPPSALLVTDLSVSQAVPEPATWAMFLIGFGAIGYAMRRPLRKIVVPFA